MKVLFLLVLALLLFSSRSKAQSSLPASLFSEENYSEISRGVDPDNSFNEFVIIFKSTIDTTLALKKIFRDSSYTDLMIKAFYKSDLPEGPYSIYGSGQLIFQANYKNGLNDGEITTYNNTTVIKKGTFTNGLKTGTWEEHDTAGKLVRKTIFDTDGNMVSDERY